MAATAFLSPVLTQAVKAFDPDLLLCGDGESGSVCYPTAVGCEAFGPVFSNICPLLFMQDVLTEPSPPLFSQDGCF